ncbi:hypothetical protein ElyMa_001791900 [Elysia marginata]|uniref:Fibronectin type-III domain-containing protein n=1 Tax=Elysia marginata TaxID=1093978 RepID=A0AAV4EEV8_9GAST|nr:hypothetical protein ElyMa_001791900 [Elysia marginata]
MVYSVSDWGKEEQHVMCQRPPGVQVTSNGATMGSMRLARRQQLSKGRNSVTVTATGQWNPAGVPVSTKL